MLWFVKFFCYLTIWWLNKFYVTYQVKVLSYFMFHQIFCYLDILVFCDQLWRFFWAKRWYQQCLILILNFQKCSFKQRCFLNNKSFSVKNWVYSRISNTQLKKFLCSSWVVWCALNFDLAMLKWLELIYLLHFAKLNWRTDLNWF